MVLLAACGQQLSGPVLRESPRDYLSDTPPARYGVNRVGREGVKQFLTRFYGIRLKTF